MDVPSQFAALLQFPLFFGVPAPQLQDFCARLRRRFFRHGATLMLAGDHGGTVYIVESGLVKICAEHCGSGMVLLGLLGPGEILGEIDAIDSGGHSADVTAALDCTCWCMTSASFRECLRVMPDLSFNLLRLTVKRLRLTTEKIAMLSTQNVPGRIARQLLILAEQCGVPTPDGATEITLPLKHSDLAALTATRRQTVSTVLGQFRDTKAITITPANHIIIRCPEVLRRKCE